jgi:hypothetical protein
MNELEQITVDIVEKVLAAVPEDRVLLVVNILKTFGAERFRAGYVRGESDGRNAHDIDVKLASEELDEK